MTTTTTTNTTLETSVRTMLDNNMNKNILMNGADVMFKSIITLATKVDERESVLVNLTNTDIDNAQEWFETTKTLGNVLYLNLDSLDEIVRALDGEGEYAHQAFVLRKDDNCSTVPQDVFQLNDNGVLYSKDHVNSVMSKIEKDMHRLRKARKERAKKAERSKIYNTSIAQFTVYDMQYESDDPNSWHFIPTIMTMPTSELLRAIITNYNLSYTYTRNLVKCYKLDQIVQLNFRKGFKQAKDFKRLYKSAEGKLYVSLSCLESEDDQELDFSDNSIAGYRCIEGNLNTAEVPGGIVETFINISNGASGVRKNACLFLLEDDKVEKVLNDGSRGIYGRLKGKKLNRSKSVKGKTRATACIAPSQVLYEADSFGIYVGEFGTGMREDVYADDFKELKGTADGIVVSIFDAMQSRLGSSKSFATKMTPDMLRRMAQHLDSNYIVLDVKEGDCEQAQSVLTKIFEDKKVTIDGEEINLNDRVVVFRKEGSKVDYPQYFGDLNSFKADFDVEKGFEIPVLDMPIKNYSHSSTQFLTKVLAVGGEKAVKLIETRLRNHAEKLLNELYQDKELTLGDVKNPYIKGLIGKCASAYLKYDKSARVQSAKLMLNSLSKSFNRARFDILDSANGRALPDVGLFFDLRLLAEDEIYSPDVKGGKDVIIIKYPCLEACGYWKAKTVGYKEMRKRINKLALDNELKRELKNYFRSIEPGCTMMPASKAIMACLAGMDFDYDMVIVIHDEELVELFKDAAPGVVNIINNFVDKTEKRTFNYDTMFDTQAELIIQEAMDVGELTNNYNIIAQFELMCKYHKNVLNRYYAQLEKFEEGSEKHNKLQDAIQKEEKAIAHLVQTFRVLVDFSFIDSKKQAELKKKLTKTEMAPYDFTGKAVRINQLQKLFNPLVDRSNGAAYKPMETRAEDPNYSYLPITADMKEKAENQMRACTINTLDEVLAMCADIIRIARHDQEITIDSAKTSITATICMNFKSMFNLFSKVEYEYEINQDTKRITRYVKVGSSAYNDLGKKYYIYDILSMIRDKVEGYIIPKVQDYIDNYTVTQEEISAAFPSYEGTKNLAACMEMANVYGKIAFYSANLTDVANKKDFTAYYKAIRNIVLSVCDPLLNTSATKMGRFAYWLSCFGKDTTGRIAQKASKTNFNITCFPIESLYLAYKLSGKLQRVCEPVVCVEDLVVENQTYDFVNGDAYNEDGELVVVAKEFLNGEFRLMKVDGKYMACSGLSQHLDRNDYDKDVIVLTLKGVANDLKGKTLYVNRENMSRHNVQVIVNDENYQSAMYVTLAAIEDFGSHFVIEDSFNDGETTFVLARKANVAKEEVIEDNMVPGYVPDMDYMPTEEEQAEIMDYCPLDFDLDYDELGSFDFENNDTVEEFEY